MTQLNEIGSSFSGILQPQLAHQFQVIFPSLGVRDVVSQSIIRCQFDLINNTMTLELEQPQVDAGVFDAVRSICKGCYDVLIRNMNGNDQAIAVLRFIGCKATHHLMAYDYAVTGVATHKIIIQFDDMIVQKP